MKTYRIMRGVIALAAIALLIALAGPVTLSAQTTTPPPWGVPGSTFTFKGVGFKGGDKDNPNEAGERIVVWINAPDGTIISTRHLEEKDAEGNADVPLAARARHDGTVIFPWTAPMSSKVGPYTVVLHGLSSGVEQVLPFMIMPQAALTTTEHTISPTVGQPGTNFEITAAGFAKGAKPGDPGEQVTYWINLPDGRVISTEVRPARGKEDARTVPLMVRARNNGTVRLSWEAPADAPAGAYTIVLHGLTSQEEVVIPFTIR